MQSYELLLIGWIRCCVFNEYRAHGWQLCDIPPGTKGPRADGWNVKGAPVHGQQGVGLCHAYSGTCSVDVDNYPVAREWLAKQGIDLDALLLAPESVQIVSGRVDRAKLLYRLATPLASVSLAPYQKLSEATGKMKKFHALELRCATRSGLTVQDVLPPTIHPDTSKPYVWAYGDDAFGHWSNLPPLPSAIVALWEAQSATSAPEPQSAVAPQDPRYIAIRAWLAKQDPDCEYPQWLTIGMRINHETKGSADGLALWDEWSRQGATYGESKGGKPAQYPRDKWASFNPNEPNAVTFGGALREEVAAPTDFGVVEPSADDVGEDTRPEARIKALLEKNLVFVRAQEMYYDISSTGHPWLTDRGIRHVFGPYMPTIKSAGKNGKPDKVVKPDPVQWLANSQTKTTVDMAGMHPGAARLYTEDGLKYVNNYVPIAIEDLAPLAQEKEAFAFLWSRMRDPVFRSWLLKFYAYALKYPGVKIQSAPLLVSEKQGTGKNTLMKVLPEILFGSRYVRSMSGNVLAGQFNGAIGATWWLYLEELRAGSNKADRMHTTNKIKSWITDNTIEVHRKGIEAYDIRNRVQVTATSNFTDALQLDNNDRRWAIGEMLGPLTPAESLDLYSFLLSDRAPGVLRHIFRRVDTVGFQPAAKAPETFAKKQMIVAGLGNWESKLIECIVSGETPFDRDLFTLKDVTDLMMGQGMSPHMLSRMLKVAPFNCELLQRFTKRRIWAWRNIAEWQDKTETERLQYIQTGTYPAKGDWTKVIPTAILAMSAESGVDSNLDLL